MRACILHSHLHSLLPFSSAHAPSFPEWLHHLYLLVPACTLTAYLCPSWLLAPTCISLDPFTPTFVLHANSCSSCLLATSMLDFEPAHVLVLRGGRDTKALFLCWLLKCLISEFLLSFCSCYKNEWYQRDFMYYWMPECKYLNFQKREHHYRVKWKKCQHEIVSDLGFPRDGVRVEEGVGGRDNLKRGTTCS